MDIHQEIDEFISNKELRRTPLTLYDTPPKLNVTNLWNQTELIDKLYQIQTEENKR